MAARSLIIDPEAADVSDYHSDSEMQDGQEPHSDPQGFNSPESDKENDRLSQNPPPSVHNEISLLHAKKRAGSPTLHSPSTRPRLSGKSDEIESTIERIPSASQKTRGVIKYLHKNAQSIEINGVAREASETEGDRVAPDLRDIPSTFRGNDTESEKFKGEVPYPTALLAELVSSVCADSATAPTTDPSLDRMWPLVIAANDAYENARSLTISERSKAPSPLAAQEPDTTVNGRHVKAQAVDAKHNNVKENMALDDTSGQPSNHSSSLTHEAGSGRKTLINDPHTIPHESTTERPELDFRSSRAQLAVSISTPTPMSTKDIHEWANYNDVKPYHVALAIRDGTINNLRNPAEVASEDPYNDGYRYWTLPEYNILLAEQDEKTSWEKIARLLPGRDAEECRKRWERRDTLRIPEADGRHPHWHKEEENILFNERSKNKGFEEIAGMLPARSKAGCKTRWKKKFETSQKPEPEWGHPQVVDGRAWTKKENDELIDCREQGMSFTQIAEKYPARARQSYKEHWNELKMVTHRVRPENDILEDSSFRASKKQEARAIKNQRNRALIPREYATRDGHPGPHYRVGGSSESSSKHGGYNSPDGKSLMVDEKTYAFSQDSQSSYSTQDHQNTHDISFVEARPSCKNHFTSSGYTQGTVSASIIPPPRLTLPPISTLTHQYPFSAPPCPDRRPPTGPLYFNKNGRWVPAGMATYGDSVSAVEPRAQQPSPVTQNEQPTFLYRRHGDRWEKTEFIDPGQQHGPSYQAPRALNNALAQESMPSTQDAVLLQQASPFQPP